MRDSVLTFGARTSLSASHWFVKAELSPFTVEVAGLLHVADCTERVIIGAVRSDDRPVALATRV